MESRRVPLRHVIFICYVAACLLAIVWPGYAWFGNRIEPYVAGLPFSLAWIVSWVLATFVALALYHWANERVTDRRER